VSVYLRTHTHTHTHTQGRKGRILSPTTKPTPVCLHLSVCPCFEWQTTIHHSSFPPLHVACTPFAHATGLVERLLYVRRVYGTLYGNHRR
jgi:hypothetical protein